MTQLGRYTHITKQKLHSYQIVQDNIFTIDGLFEDGSRTAHALPFDTHIHYQADESEGVAQKTLSMGERTCFLHAAMRDTFRSEIEAELNGKALAIR